MNRDVNADQDFSEMMTVSRLYRGATLEGPTFVRLCESTCEQMGQPNVRPPILILMRLH